MYCACDQCVQHALEDVCPSYHSMIALIPETLNRSKLQQLQTAKRCCSAVPVYGAACIACRELRGVWRCKSESNLNHMNLVPRPGRLRFDRFCKWPISDLDVWQIMLSLNKVNIARVQAALSPPSQPLPSQHPSSHTPPNSKKPTVITMSHFLPRTELPFSHGVSEMAKAVGCLHLEGQISQLGSDLHVHGHTHISCDVTLPVAGPAGQGAVQNGGVGGNGTDQQQQQGGQAGAGMGVGGSDGSVRQGRRYVHHALDGSCRPSLYCVWVRGKGLVGETVPV